MKRIIIFTVFMLCLLTGTVNATEYIVEINKDIFETGIDNAELFEKMNAPDKFLYVTEELDTIKQLEEQGMVVYYEENIQINIIDDAVYEDENIPVMLSSLYDEFDVSKASYATFTNNLIARDIPKGEYTVRVGIIDSGIAVNDASGNSREDFGNVVAGKSFVDAKPFYDKTNHGTPCAGLIGGKFSGIAPDCEMISLKAFSSSSGSLDDVTNAIYAAVDDYGCKVINISASAPAFTTTFKEAVEHAIKNNVIVVAAVGNNGNTTSANTYPANFSGVIGVGSVNSAGVHSSFSRVNSTVDACAIGEYVYTTVSTDYSSNKYNYISGTSFSAPQISGLAALLCSYDIDLTPNEFIEILEATAFDPGESGYDTTYGHGIIDVKEAVEFLLKQPQIYSSRIFKSGDNLNYKVYNNTIGSKTITVIKANYNESGSVMNYAPIVVKLPSQTATPISDAISCDFTNDEYFRVMVWRSFKNMIPLYKAREYTE